jgi:hypothetical protein
MVISARYQADSAAPDTVDEYLVDVIALCGPYGLERFIGLTDADSLAVIGAEFDYVGQPVLRGTKREGVSEKRPLLLTQRDAMRKTDGEGFEAC